VKTHRFASHSPEEQRRLSNLGHLLEGLLLAVVGCLALLNNVASISWAGMAWPIMLLVAGILLLILIYPRHPLVDWPSIWKDPQQRQHTLMALAITVGGAAELADWWFIWPLAILLIGVQFLAHTQHGQSEAVSRAVLKHRVLGSTLVLAGLLNLVENIIDADVLAILWPIVLLTAAAQLFLYREPEGAFEAYHGHEG